MIEPDTPSGTLPQTSQFGFDFNSEYGRQFGRDFDQLEEEETQNLISASDEDDENDEDDDDEPDAEETAAQTFPTRKGVRYLFLILIPGKSSAFIQASI